MMNKAGGFITLHRQILEWEWYMDINTKVLFLHLLLTANFTDGRFEGMTIQRGQLVTSLPSLAAETALSVRQVRTALDHLMLTGEVTSKAYHKFRVITIVKYNDYQDNDRQVDSQMTGNRQPNDRQVTGNRQQYNNNNNNNKGTMKQGNTPTESPDTVPADMFDLFWKEYPNKVAKQDALKAWKKLKMNPEMLGAILNGLSRWKVSDEWNRDGGRFIPHPATWLNGHRWEDEVKPKQVTAQQYGQRDYAQVQADILRRQNERIKKRLNADNFQQRDYSDVNDKMMIALAKEVEQFQKDYPEEGVGRKDGWQKQHEES